MRIRDDGYGCAKGLRCYKAKQRSRVLLPEGAGWIPLRWGARRSGYGMTTAEAGLCSMLTAGEVQLGRCVLSIRFGGPT